MLSELLSRKEKGNLVSSPLTPLSVEKLWFWDGKAFRAFCRLGLESACSSVEFDALHRCCVEAASKVAPASFIAEAMTVE